MFRIECLKQIADGLMLAVGSCHEDSIDFFKSLYRWKHASVSKQHAA